jgi:tetratricopeptide (TPR) repeat protein
MHRRALMRRYCLIGIISLILACGLLPTPAKADYKQAVAYYNQKRFDKAIQELKGDLDRNPDWEFGYRLLGLCYLGLNNNALAVSALSRAVQLKSTEFSTYYGLGQAYFNMQKYDNCVTALNQGEPLAAKEKDPEREKAKLYKLRGSAYYQMGRYEDAKNDFTNAIRVNQSDWTDFFKLGICYLKLNRTDEAVQALEKVLSMKPGESQTTELLGDVYLRKGNAALAGKQYESAIQALFKAKEYIPKNGYVYYNLAEAYLFQKKYSDAEKSLNQAANLMPRVPEVYWRMGFVYEKQKKWDLALNAYKKADDIKPLKDLKEAIARVNENMKK